MGKMRIRRKKVLTSMLIPILLASTLLIFPASAEYPWYWSRPRPSIYTDYDDNEKIGNAKTDGAALVQVGVGINSYTPNAGSDPDHLSLKTSFSANTRVSITYEVGCQSFYGLYQVSTPTGINSDHSSVWKPLPFWFTLYGVYCNGVWISDDGLLCFDSDPTGSTPVAIPSTNTPNSIIAPFWRDLDPSLGGSITYGTIGSPPNQMFVVSWNGVPNKAPPHAAQTFQVVLWQIGAFSGLDSCLHHNRIWFQYGSVTTDVPTVVGIENIGGDMGTPYDYTAVTSNSCLQLRYPIAGYRVRRLTIELSKSDTYAIIGFVLIGEEEYLEVGGQNVVLSDTRNRFAGLFTLPIQASILAATALDLIPSGIVMGTLLIGYDAAATLSENLSPPNFDIRGANVDDTMAYVTAGAANENPSYGTPFDATLTAGVLWFFTDPSDDQTHHLTITARLEYAQYYDDYTPPTYHDISTSVFLTMYKNYPPYAPSLSGPSSGCTGTDISFSSCTADYEWDDLRYEFYWGDGTYTTTDLVPCDTIVIRSHAWTVPGVYTISVRAQDKWGAWSNSITKSVSISTRPPYPPWLTGPPSGFGYVNTAIPFTATADDQDLDDVRYEFNWGDGTPNDLTGFVDSGTPVTRSHVWTVPNPYTISVKAQDVYGAWSSPSTTFVRITPGDAGSGGDAGNSHDSAIPIAPGNYAGELSPGTGDQKDYYKFSVPNGYYIHVVLTLPITIDFNLELYDPLHPYSYVMRSANAGNGVSETIDYTATMAGDWRINVYTLYSQDGTYYFSVSVSSSPPPPPPPPGGCPYVYTWNGTSYVIDNNILPTSERSNGTDVNDYYKLEQSLVQRDGEYSLFISEFEHEHSYIDQVKLLAVDHDSDVRIAVDPNGQILTYKNPAAPRTAVDNYGNSRLNEIRSINGNVSNPATFFYGNASDYLVLNFGRVSSDKAKLILRDDQKCMECCIDVQVLNSAGQWHTVTTVAPRSYWSVEGVDLSAYVIRNRDFKVRLVWTSPHKLDYAGLDTTRQADYQVTYANLVSATHSTQGDVTNLLTTNDNQYAELIPGQLVLLDFTLPDNQQEARTYILYTEGHYYTIP